MGTMGTVGPFPTSPPIPLPHTQKFSYSKNSFQGAGEGTHGLRALPTPPVYPSSVTRSDGSQSPVTPAPFSVHPRNLHTYSKHSQIYTQINSLKKYSQRRSQRDLSSVPHTHTVPLIYVTLTFENWTPSSSLQGYLTHKITFTAQQVSQTLNQQPGACMGMTQALCIYVAVVQVGPLVGLLTVATRVVSDSFTGLWDHTHTGLL